MSNIPSNQKKHFDRARAAIEKRDYKAARRALAPVASHPTAQKWIAKIDELNLQSIKEKGQSIGCSPVIVAVLVLMVGIGGFSGGFVLGSSSDDSQAVESNSTRTETLVPAPSEEVKVTSTPTTEVATVEVSSTSELGTEENPYPSETTFIETSIGNFFVFDVQWPSWLPIDDPFDDRRLPAQPIRGADYATVQLMFNCPETEVTCKTQPVTELVLEDGRVVENRDFEVMSSLNFEEVVGGSSTLFWAVYEVPSDATLSMLKIIGAAPDGGDVYWSLPEPKDGNAEQPWEENSDEEEIQPLSKMQRNMLGVFLNVNAVYLRKDGDEITLVVEVQSDADFSDEDGFIYNPDLQIAVNAARLSWEESDLQFDNFELAPFWINPFSPEAIMLCEKRQVEIMRQLEVLVDYCDVSYASSR